MSRAMTAGSLFAGIGGFDLGFERAGIVTEWQVEIDEWKRAVLSERFPRAERFANVRDCGSHNLKHVDIISGGFPCQPFSTSGKRLGAEDDRYLWPEMLRVVVALRPTFVVAENVAGLAHEFDWILEQVCDDLEAEGYKVLPPLMVPLASFGSWHKRDRVWILAHLDQGVFSPKQEQQQEERHQEFHRSDWWDAEPAVDRLVHGVPSRLDRRRIEALGESVSPVVTQWIGRKIVEACSGRSSGKT